MTTTRKSLCRNDRAQRVDPGRRTRRASRMLFAPTWANTSKPNAGEKIEGVAAKPDNPSIWASAAETLEHNDSMDAGTRHL